MRIDERAHEASGSNTPAGLLVSDGYLARVLLGDRQSSRAALELGQMNEQRSAVKLVTQLRRRLEGSPRAAPSFIQTVRVHQAQAKDFARAVVVRRSDLPLFKLHRALEQARLDGARVRLVVAERAQALDQQRSITCGLGRRARLASVIERGRNIARQHRHLGRQLMRGGSTPVCGPSRVDGLLAQFEREDGFPFDRGRAS